MKKVKLSSEIAYLFSLIILSLAVAMEAAADYGVSMIVAPAYMLHVKTGVLSFGQCEYILQAVLFIIFCILLKRVKPIYFCSFVTCIIYGAMLDAWRLLPLFDADITLPGSMATVYRILLLGGGMMLTAVSIAMIFRVYLYPQVYDFFVKGISERFGFNKTKCKSAFDACCLILSVVLSFAFFGRFHGIGVGTVVMTVFNGPLIGLCGKVLDKIVTFEPKLKKLSRHFEI